MLRRNFITAAGLLIGSSLTGREAIAEAPQSGRDKVAARLLKAFLSLPGKKSAQIDVDAPRHPWRIAHDPEALLFCGSCFKTFVLTAYLQEVEAGLLSESEQIDINDGIRSVGGGVFEFLTGTAAARTVLEAMIAHSDNTATDAAMSRVGVASISVEKRRDTSAYSRQHASFLFVCGRLSRRRRHGMGGPSGHECARMECKNVLQSMTNNPWFALRAISSPITSALLQESSSRKRKR
jgi:hypothetical protein